MVFYWRFFYDGVNGVVCYGAGGVRHDLGGSGSVQKENWPHCSVFISSKLGEDFEVAYWRRDLFYGTDDTGARVVWLGGGVTREPATTGYMWVRFLIMV